MATALTSEQISERMKTLPGWEVTDGVIMKTYLVESYIAGAAFAATIATVCEGLNHHPDQLCIGWKKVKVSFTTHDAGNVLTKNDFNAAAAIQSIPLKQAM